MSDMSAWAFPGLKYESNMHRPYEDTLLQILDYNGLEKSDIMKRNRQREIVDTRMICITALRYEHRWTLKRIGEFFNQHHTSVIHALVKVKSLSQTDEHIRNQVEKFCPQILISEKLYR